MSAKLRRLFFYFNNGEVKIHNQTMQKELAVQQLISLIVDKLSGMVFYMMADILEVEEITGSLYNILSGRFKIDTEVIYAIKLVDTNDKKMTFSFWYK